jgi:hypothetical protein
VTNTERLLTIVRDASEQPECVRCADRIRALQLKIEQLAKENERLIRAIQRESHHMDTRAPHDGKNYIRRNR